MAKERGGRANVPQAVTPERAARLYRLLRLLDARPRTRGELMRFLKLDVRGFYRDLEFLRGAAIGVILDGSRYHLAGDLDAALRRLPLPDAHLTLGEALLLAKGRTQAHLKLKRHIATIVP